MRACPHCGATASSAPGRGDTCGGFRCLYRCFCGADLPIEQRDFPNGLKGSLREVARIAVVRPGQLGDLLLAIPGLRALKTGLPGSEITLIARPWAADLARRFPYIDRVLAIDEPLEDRRGEALQRCEVPAGGYDLVLQLHADSTSAARFALALGGRTTAGFCRDEAVGRGFDLLLRMREDEPEILRVVRLVDALGVGPVGLHLEFPLLPSDLEELETVVDLRRLLAERPVVALHPGARAPARRWPLERFAHLADLLQRRWKATMVMVGGPEETSLVEEVEANLSAPVLNLAGKLSLGALAALLRRVDLFVGNDSGPAQLAAAVAPRSLRIFGPANRRRWAPLDRTHHRIVYRQVECSPCGHWECPIDHRCLRWVTVEEVVSEVEALLTASLCP